MHLMSRSLKREECFYYRSLQWWVLIQLEILRKGKCFYYEIVMCLDVFVKVRFSPFTALNIKTTPPHLCLEPSDGRNK